MILIFFFNIRENLDSEICPFPNLCYMALSLLTSVFSHVSKEMEYWGEEHSDLIFSLIGTKAICLS